MGVSIQRHGNGIVSKELFERSWVDAPPQKQRGERMPEIMEADLGRPAFLSSGLKERFTRSRVRGVPFSTRRSGRIFVKVGESHPVLQLLLRCALRVATSEA